MRFPWDDDAERALAEQRAYGRAERRGLGAALLREIPRDPGEPFIGIFVVSDGMKALELLAQFSDWPGLVEAAAHGRSAWVLERAVEDELLRRACRRDFDGIASLATPLGAPLVIRPAGAQRP